MGIGKGLVNAFSFIGPVRRFFIERKYHSIGWGTVWMNFFFQRIIRINSRTRWMVHFTSRVIFPHRITITESDKAYNVYRSFAASPHCYIQAVNGITIGRNFLFGPGLHVISANHETGPDRKAVNGSPIIIGNDVWVGAQVNILPEVNIGNNVIIGAGSVVTSNVPDNCIVAGNPARVIKELTQTPEPQV